jgi:hypothetical protein
MTPQHGTEMRSPRRMVSVFRPNLGFEQVAPQSQGPTRKFRRYPPGDGHNAGRALAYFQARIAPIARGPHGVTGLTDARRKTRKLLILWRPREDSNHQPQDFSTTPSARYTEGTSRDKRYFIKSNLCPTVAIPIATAQLTALTHESVI